MSSPRFVVSHYVFAEHSSFAQAEAERVPLSAVFTKKKFKVYCITDEYDNAECADQKRKAKAGPFTDVKELKRQTRRKITLENFKPKTPAEAGA